MKILPKYIAMCILIFNSCEQEITTPIINKPVTEFGSLFVNTNPPGARIYVDNLYSGHITPDTVRWISPGTYDIRLSLQNYKDTSLTISISAGKTESLFFDFNADPRYLGAIYCTSKPSDADIYVGDSLTGKKTPSIINNLLPGEYTLTYRINGFRDSKVKAIVQSGVVNYPSLGILIDTTVWVHYKKSNSPIASDNLTCIAIENGSIKWIGTLNEGLIKLEGDQWTLFTTENSNLPDNYITCISIDNQNRKWIGTLGGVGVFSDGSWIIYNTQNSGLPDDYITDIAFHPNGSVLITTISKGFAILKDGMWRVYDHSNSKLIANGTAILSAFITEYGSTWLGATSPPSIYNFTAIKDMVVHHILFGGRVVDIDSDRDGTIWFALGGINFEPFPALPGGMAYFVNDKLNVVLGKPSQKVTSIAVDKINNNIWFGNFGSGLARYSKNENVWTYFNHLNSGLETNFITDVAIDNEGIRWLATFSDGLVKFK
jgi:hypothetical protein